MVLLFIPSKAAPLYLLEGHMPPKLTSRTEVPEKTPAPIEDTSVGMATFPESPEFLNASAAICRLELRGANTSPVIVLQPSYSPRVILVTEAAIVRTPGLLGQLAFTCLTNVKVRSNKSNWRASMRTLVIALKSVWVYKSILSGKNQLLGARYLSTQVDATLRSLKYL